MIEAPPMIWQADRMLLGDFVFRLEHGKSNSWELGEDCFAFYKTQRLVSQYQKFWAQVALEKPRHVMELGIWDGGSAAFWFEWFKPERLVAVDILQRGDSAYFRKYKTERGLSGRLRTHWGVNQADRARLIAIAENELDGEIDLVLDDASHIYEPTLASFEALFPLIRPGGFYVIEDWAWGHVPEFTKLDSRLARFKDPAPLVMEVIQAAGTSADVVSSVSVFKGFVAVERGPAKITQPFALSRHIRKRPIFNRYAARVAKRLQRR